MATRLSSIRAAGQRVYVLGYHRLRLDLWFPHAPLAMAVGGAGMLELLPVIRRYAAEYLHLDLDALMHTLQPVSGEVPQLILSGVPSTVVGVLQVLIALGLLARSRVAWLSAVTIAVAQLALTLHMAGQIISYETVYVALLLAALWLTRNWFDHTSLAASTLFALVLILVLTIYGVLGSFLLGADFAPPITNLPTAFYFTIVTMATVGYGDIVPISHEARFFVVSLIALGLTVFATALTALIGPAIQARLNRAIGTPEKKPMKRIHHFIITGDGPLAHNTSRELHRRGEPVLVIAEKPGVSFGEAEVMIGDPTEIETLREAGAEHARAVLALSDDDSENAFVILAMHELTSDAKKVAAVNSRKNLERVRRVHPDMVLAASVFGSEALAMALTEEKIDGNWLLSRLLDVEPGSH